MKKVFKVFVLMLSVLLITGCISEKSREEINEQFIKKGIIDKKWKLIDTYTESHYSAGLRSNDGYGYVYKSSDNKMHLLYISGHVTDINKNSALFYVEIYNISHINELEPTKEECGNTCVSYSDGKYTTESKYIVDKDSKKEYGITRTYKQILIFRRKTWLIEEGVKR